MRLPVDRGLPLIALIFLAACGSGGSRVELAAPAPSAGPGADYPVVLGPAFTIDGITYTPADKLNFDQVGHAVTGTEGGAGVSLAHRTLPLPSYVEVTSLDTGRTVLVRAERRGPMSGSALVELSPGAATQLGVDPAGRAPVRVRRVNPPEIERAALRRGGQVPNRMDTPQSLVAVLRRRLDGPAAAPTVAPAVAAVAAVEVAKPPRDAARTHKPPMPPVAAVRTVEAKPPRDAARARAPITGASEPMPGALAPTAEAPLGTRLVQVGAFSSKANAEATAAKLGGKLQRSGQLWLVRMGPYLARGEVAAALAKARGAGYSDARIQRVD